MKASSIRGSYEWACTIVLGLVAFWVLLLAGVIVYELIGELYG